MRGKANVLERGTYRIFHSMLRLGTPPILIQLALMGVGVTDSTMLGWYFVEGLAAGVLGHTVYLLFHGWWWFWYGRHTVDG